MSETAEATEERPGTALVEYSETEKGLAELRGRLAKVAYDLTTVKGNKEARADRLELVTLRTSLEKRRKELNADDQARIAKRNERAKELTVQIVALEEPIDDQIKRDEERRERQRREAAELAARVVAEQAAILDSIRNYLVRASHKGSVVIESLIEQLVGIDAEKLKVAPGAEDLRDGVLRLLRAMHAEATEAEAEARRLRAEREAFEREQAAAKVAAAEREAAEAAKRAEEQAEAERAQAERLAEYRRRDEEIEAKARVLAEAEEAQKRRQEAEQTERDRIEAEARAEGERQEAAERAEREAAAAFNRDWFDAIAEDGRRTAELEERRRQAQAAAAREAELKAARERDTARHQARADALDLVSDLAAMPEKPPIKSVWLEIRARAIEIRQALAEVAPE